MIRLPTSFLQTLPLITPQSLPPSMSTLQINASVMEYSFPSGFSLPEPLSHNGYHATLPRQHISRPRTDTKTILNLNWSLTLRGSFSQSSLSSFASQQQYPLPMPLPTTSPLLFLLSAPTPPTSISISLTITTQALSPFPTPPSPLFKEFE